MFVTGFLVKSVTYQIALVPSDFNVNVRKVTGLPTISLINDLLIFYIYEGVWWGVTCEPCNLLLTNIIISTFKGVTTYVPYNRTIIS